MTTFLLIRHGLTSAVGKSISGWLPGWHLNPEGKRQVANLAERLASIQIHALYTSPLERASETADAIARGRSIVPQPEPEIGEMRVGEWEGLSFEELDQREDWRQFNASRATAPTPGGELMIEVQARMVKRLQCLYRRHPEQTVAIVSHADPLRALIAYHLGMPLDHLLRFEVSPASVSVLQVFDSSARVLCLNHHGDLPI